MPEEQYQPTIYEKSSDIPVEPDEFLFNFGHNSKVKKSGIVTKSYEVRNVETYVKTKFLTHGGLRPSDLHMSPENIQTVADTMIHQLNQGDFRPFLQPEKYDLNSEQMAAEFPEVYGAYAHNVQALQKFLEVPAFSKGIEGLPFGNELMTTVFQRHLNAVFATDDAGNMMARSADEYKAYVANG